MMSVRFVTKRSLLESRDGEADESIGLTQVSSTLRDFLGIIVRRHIGE